MIFPILLLALILRLINLNQSLWLDEAVQAITAKGSFAYIFQEIVGDFHPPLYHFLMHYWATVFGTSEIALRMPSVLFGVGTVWLVYKIAIVFSGYQSQITNHKSLATIAALFLATAPFHIFYSQEARMYSLACFLAALSIFYFIKISNIKYPLQGKQISKTNLKLKTINLNLILYFISTILLIYSDYYGFLVLFAQGIYLLAQKRYKFLLLNSCLPAGMALFLILCYLPWLPMFLTQLKTGALAIQALPGWGKLVNLSFFKAIPLTFIKFSIGRISLFNKTLYAGVAGVIIGLYGFLILRTVRRWIKDKLKDDKGILIAWFLVPLLTAWLVSLFVPNFQPFRLLLILPAFYLLLLFGIFSFKSKALRNGLIALILIINLSSLAVYYFNPYFQREDWKGLVNFLKKQENSQVLLPSETSNWPIKYYDPENKIKLVYGAKGINTINELSINGLTDYELRQEKIYYIRYLTPLFDPDEAVLKELVGKGYTKEREINFNQIPLWEYRLLTDYQLTD